MLDLDRLQDFDRALAELILKKARKMKLLAQGANVA